MNPQDCIGGARSAAEIERNIYRQSKEWMVFHEVRRK